MVESCWRRATRVLLVTVIAGAALATLLAGIGRWWWFGDLWTHFRPQYVVLFAAGGLAALWLRRRALVIVATAGMLLNVVHIARVAYAHDAVVIADGRPVRLVSFNVAFFNRDFSRIAPYLESLQADVISLQEVPTPELAGMLAGLASYPHHYLEGRAGNYGSMIVSRWPLTSTRVLQLGGGNGMTADVTVVFPDARLRLFSLHAMWPMTSRAAAVRNLQLDSLGKVLADCLGNCMAVGDFNVTRWSTHFQDLLETSDMRDCARGLFIPDTWPSWPVPLRLRIDQCVASGSVEVVAVTSGPRLGSDHLPTVNDLRLSRDAR